MEKKKKKDNKERLAIIVSAFPGCGKTTLFENIKKKYGDKVLISDSDSSKFDKSDFPQNYIEWISDNINNYDIILVSSHKEVRKELENRGINFDIYYPSKDRRMEFILNYVRRGNNFSFIQKIDSNFDNWIDEIENDESEFIHKHKLEGETFLENDILINNFINSIATK
jgi:hypothetical protein